MTFYAKKFDGFKVAGCRLENCYFLYNVDVVLRLKLPHNLLDRMRVKSRSLFCYRSYIVLH